MILSSRIHSECLRLANSAHKELAAVPPGVRQPVPPYQPPFLLTIFSYIPYQTRTRPYRTRPG